MKQQVRFILLVLSTLAGGLGLVMCELVGRLRYHESRY